MPHFNTGMGGNSRGLFPGHGAGKGDKNRSKLDDNYRANFDAINFPKSDEGFEKREGKITKRYGQREPEKFDKAPRVRIGGGLR
jgi:hypothetical protein